MKNTSVSIRFTAEQEARLTFLANRYKVPKTIIISWAVDALSEYSALHGDHVPLPINFDLLWEATKKTSTTHGIEVSQKHKEGFRADVENLSRNVNSLNEDPAEYPAKPPSKRKAG